MLMAVRAWLTKPTAAGAALGVAAVLAPVAGMVVAMGAVRNAPPTGDWVEIGRLRAPLLATAAVLVLVAAVDAWRGDEGWRVRALASLLLLLVIAQGQVGGLRVRLNALYGTQLAMLHGPVAQLALATAVVLAAVFTSRGSWRRIRSCRDCTVGLGSIPRSSARVVFSRW